MAIELTINGTPYEYPVAGDEPGWGGDASDWAQAVTDVLNTLLAPGDILQTTFTIDNNISVATNINGLLFDPGSVRGARIEMAVYRTSDDNPYGNAEFVIINLVYDDEAPSGQKWNFTQMSDGESGVAFSITDDGQIQYISTDIGTIGYSGVVEFKASVLNN